VDHLLLFENLGGSQDDLASQVDRVALQRDIPVSQLLGLHQHADSALDLFHFFVWLSSAEGETVAHAGASANLIGDAINAAKFRREVDITVTMLDHNEWLLQVRDRLFVHAVHVLGD